MKKSKMLPILSIAFSALLIAGCSTDDSASSQGGATDSQNTENNLSPEQKRKAEEVLEKLGIHVSKVEDVLNAVKEEHGENIVFLSFDSPKSGDTEEEASEDDAPYTVSFYHIEDEKFYDATVSSEDFAVSSKTGENPLGDVEKERFEFGSVDVDREIEILEEMAMSPVASFTVEEEDDMLVYTFTHENELEHEIFM